MMSVGACLYIDSVLLLCRINTAHYLHKFFIFTEVTAKLALQDLNLYEKLS